MSYRLPEALSTADDTRALRYLKTYYGLDGDGQYTGSYFDAWGAAQDPDRFTAEDLVAVSFLSVFVPPIAAHRLLITEADRFSELLQAIGPDRDLVTETRSIDASWPGRRLNAALDALPGVGPTIASKLCARKRPRLIPIYDSVVARVTNAYDKQWEPLRTALQGRTSGVHTSLHERLLGLRERARLESHISAIRVYDVVTWMEGKAKNYEVTPPIDKLGEALAEPPADDDWGQV
jgi:Family of unknown function (DUF6308)